MCTLCWFGWQSSAAVVVDAIRHVCQREQNACASFSIETRVPKTRTLCGSHTRKHAECDTRAPFAVHTFRQFEPNQPSQTSCSTTTTATRRAQGALRKSAIKRHRTDASAAATPGAAAAAVTTTTLCCAAVTQPFVFKRCGYVCMRHTFTNLLGNTQHARERTGWTGGHRTHAYASFARTHNSPQTRLHSADSGGVCGHEHAQLYCVYT